MNRSYREYTLEREFWPDCKSICSSKFIDIKASEDSLYAVTQYFHNNEEGILFVSDQNGETIHSKITTKSNTAIFPKLCVHNKELFIFWSECEDSTTKSLDFKWVLHYSDMSTGFKDHKTIPLNGDVFVTDTCSYNDSVYVTCEYCHGNQCDIVLLEISKNGEIKTIPLTNGEMFAKRAQICATHTGLYIVWDGYGSKGYDIYGCKYMNNERFPVNKLTSGVEWFLNPTVISNIHGQVTIGYIKSTDVERNGCIGRAETVSVGLLEDDVLKSIRGTDSLNGMINLYMGLLPASRYFGYVGLRRNPHLALKSDGIGILLTWEKHRDEVACWDNVENGDFLCIEFDHTGIGSTTMLHSGGNSFTRLVNTGNKQYYACRAERRNDIDINFFQAKPEAADQVRLPFLERWNEWNPVDLSKGSMINNPQIRWGDLHCHSIHSADAEGFPDELYFYARDKAHLDFAGITDNDYYYDTIFTYSDSMYLESICKAISETGKFICFNGYEWTYYDKSSTDAFNHRSIIFYNTKRKIARRSDDSGNTYSRFKSTMNGVDAEWHAHHAEWTLSGDTNDTNVEITSAWFVNIEISDTVNRHLDNKMIFGFMGSSDNHRYIPGNSGALTGVKALVLSRANLIEAFKNRNVYATTGNRTSLHFSVNGVEMGGIVNNAIDTLQLCLKISCEDNRSIDKIQCIADNKKIIKEFDVKSRTFHQEFILENKGYTYIYARILLDGEHIDFPHNIAMAEGKFLWSSPVFIR